MTDRLTVSAAFAVVVIALSAWSLTLLLLGQHVLGLFAAVLAVGIGTGRLVVTQRYLRRVRRQRKEGQP